MTILAKGARMMPPRMHRAYRLEMSGRTLLTLLSLLTLTGLVVFYLGVVTGKGLRDPNPPAAAALAPGAPGAGQPAAGAPGSLTFNQALTAPNSQIEGLRTEQNKLAERTQNLVAQTRQELELEEVPTKTPLAAAAPAAPKGTAVKSTPVSPAVAAKPSAAPPALPRVAAAAPPTVQKPAAKPAPKPAAGAARGDTSYTVQVFSSMQQQNAQDLMAALKKKGFPAYLNQFQDADKKTWYRVRVGTGSKAEADSLAERLKRDGDIKSPRVLKL
jgi:cell division protein FtsN